MSAHNIEARKHKAGSKTFLWLTLAFLLIILVIAGVKGWRVYQKGMVVYEDVTILRAAAQTSVDGMDLEKITATMTDLQGDLGVKKSSRE